MSRIHEFLKAYEKSLPRHKIPPPDWFRDGEDALIDAQMALDEGKPDGVTDLCQQAVQMYLSGFLVLGGLKLDDGAGILGMVKVAVPFEPSLLEHTGKLKRLTELKGDDEAEEALSLTKEFIVYLRRTVAKQLRNQRMPR